MINILIADGHPVVSSGLHLLLSKNPNFNIVGSLNSGIEIFDFVRNHNVDVLVSEVDLPELNGISAIRTLKKENKDINILMLSHQPEEIYALSTLKAGATGYLNKASDISTIEKAIRIVNNGEIFLSEKMRKHLPKKGSLKNRNRLFRRLSNREIEVLKLLSIGKKNKEIAEELDINEKTVSTYKTRMYKKLNVNNLIDLVHQVKHNDILLS